MTNLTRVTCWCSLEFAMPTQLYETCRNDGGNFHCPLGHSNVFRQTTVDKLRQERDRLKQQLAAKDDDIRLARMASEHQERRAATYKGHLTRVKKRVGHGVCPCCNRQFKDLQSHMATKHPAYVSEEEPALKVIAGGKTA